MQVLILAAGVSKRLQPLTAKIPKTLIKLEDQEILGHIFDWCISCGIKKFNIVTGHGENYIKDFVKEYQKNLIQKVYKFRYDKKIRQSDLKFNFIYNTKYKEWGNIYSMYKACDIFSEDFILINSDVIFKKEILENLLKTPYKNALVVDDYKKLGDEEMKVYLTSGSGVITKIHKKLDPRKSDGEYIGILKISSSIRDQLISALERQLKKDNSVYYEDALQILMDENVPFYKVSTKGMPCMEIDTHEDLERARKMIKECK